MIEFVEEETIDDKLDAILDKLNHMEFSREDCIRHPLVKRILKTYEDEQQIKL